MEGLFKDPKLVEDLIITLPTRESLSKTLPIKEPLVTLL